MSCHCHTETGHCEYEEKETSKRLFLIARIFISLCLALLGHFLFTEEAVGFAGHLIIMLDAYAVISYDIYIKAFRHIFLEHELFDETGLMILASLGAFALRAYGPVQNHFLEAVLVILLFQVGEVLEDLAEERSKKAIVAAIDLRHEEALVEADGKLFPKEAEDIHAGDIVRLNPGRKVYCDGVVISGEGEVDESSLTGEALPVYKRVGDTVKSGTVLNSGFLRVEASSDYENSTVARLLTLIETGAEEKSQATRFITKFAKVFTPVAILVAILLAIVPPLFEGIGDGSVWAKWIYVALSALVISCPCAIVISVPLAYFSGLGLASKKGILVKGASYFDAAMDLTIVTFDKTGTLTEGNITVTPRFLPGVNEDEALRYAILAEATSSHPIAKAICSLNPQIQASSEVEIHEVFGLGIEAKIEGKNILLGRPQLFKNHAEIELLENPKIDILLTIDGRFVGGFEIADKIKENAQQTMQELRKMGIKSMILSGDKVQRAAAVANEIGADGYRGELLPQDKQQIIRDLKASGNEVVAFCGDGINDAPALALSDIGIAMGGGGADVALENAGVVIASDDPYQVVTFLRIVKKTKHTSLINIIASLGVKAIVLVLSLIAGLTGAFALPLWVAVLADSGLAVAMVFHSLLLYFRRP